MSAKRRWNRDGSKKGPYPVNSFTPANVGPSRAALLASASLVALAALACRIGAAACSGAEPDHFDLMAGPDLQQRAALSRSTPARASTGGPDTALTP